MKTFDRVLRVLKVRKPRILFLLFQVQDLDMLLPLIKELKLAGILIEVLVSQPLAEKSPRTRQALDNSKICYSILRLSRRAGFWRLLTSSALVTAADTTARAHIISFRLVKLANLLGLGTFTLQHGLENIGLTYYDAEYPPHFVDFASKTIFTWCDSNDLDARVPEKIRVRCMPVGCPKEYRLEEIPDVRIPHLTNRALLVVFENLHWSRYSQSYRDRFLNDIEQAAKQFPAVTILVKPHPAGRWLTSRYKGKLPNSPNLIIADPTDVNWEPYTAPALIKIADAVITTPSTTAFDAVAMGKMAAIVGYDIDLPMYKPLPIIENFKGWCDFIVSLTDDKMRHDIKVKAKVFQDRVNVPGHALDRIAKHLNQMLYS